MVNFIKWSLILVFFTILQATLAGSFRTTWFSFDLLLILTVYAGLFKGVVRGAQVGFAAGLLQDIASGAILGMNTLCKTIVGTGAGHMAMRLYREKTFPQAVALFLSTILNFTLMIIVRKILDQPTDVGESVRGIFLPEMWGNVVVGLALFHVFEKYNARREISP